MKWVTLKKFCTDTGYSEAAIRQKIQRGDWLLGIHCKKSPDGRIQVNLEEYQLWVEDYQPELAVVALKA